MPLVVDLDGTLVATDTLWELLISYLRSHPLGLFSLIRWALLGKATFKRRVADAAFLDVDSLPYRHDCLQWLHAERLSGRRIVLATGADTRVAEAVAEHLGIFDGVIASDRSRNATGSNKADLIAEMLGTREYEYAGNAMADVAIWRRAAAAIVVAPDRGVLRSLRRQNIAIDQEFPAPPVTVKVWLKALRVHQWVKNLLVFTPILTSHRVLDWMAWNYAACGFLVFSLVASSTYMINDLFDLPADRRHPTKARRPLAAGLISIPASIGMVVLLLATAAFLSLVLLPRPAGLLILGYFATTLLYSAVLKKMLMADVVALAVFYTARLLYGGLVTGIEISIWTLAFCAFAFFSLAAAKRINDLAKAKLSGAESLRHRAYQTQDSNALVALSAASANIAVLVLILYLNSQQGLRLYRHPQFLWAMSIPLLYWFSRILALANRGALADDPVLFASKDRATYLVFGIMALIAIAATLA